MSCNNKKIAFINKSNKDIRFNFDYKELKDKNIDIKNINKNDILKDYDFILIYDKKLTKHKNEQYWSNNVWL